MARTTSINDFSIGQFSTSRVPENQVPPGGLKVLQNTDVRRGFARSYGFMDRIWELPESLPLQGIIKNPLADGFYLAVGPHLYYGELDGTLTELRRNVFNGLARVSMAVLNAKLFCCDGIILPKVYTVDASGGVTEDTITKATATWQESKPLYALVLFNRMWVILNDYNEVWCSVLDDATDWTVSASLTADSANAFVSGAEENTYLAIIAGLGNIVLFKRDGLDFIIPPSSSGELFDITKYSLVAGLSGVTTLNPYSVCTMSNSVYSVGPFGLQAIQREPLTSRILVKPLATNSAPIIIEGFQNTTQHCTLLPDIDNENLYFDIKGPEGRSLKRFNLQRDTIISSLDMTDVKLFIPFVDQLDGSRRYFVGYQEEVWATEGSNGFPEDLTMKIRTMRMALARGNNFKGSHIKTRSVAMGDANLLVYWNGRTEPTDQYILNEDVPAQPRWNQVNWNEFFWYGPEIGKVYRQTFPWRGSGDEVEIEVELQIGSEIAIMERIDLLYDGRGFSSNG